MDDDETFDFGEPIQKLSPRWRSLIERLWDADETSIVDFIRELVATIKSTKSASMAETGLLTALHSPKAQHPLFVLDGPGIAVPSYLANKLFADAARLPRGKVREGASAKFKASSKGKALTIQDALTSFEGPVKDTNEAALKASTRARRKLGARRRRGRPKKNEQE